MDHETISVTRLSSGWWHLRGRGPCNFAQPLVWPCDEATLRAHAFPEAGEAFIRACMLAADEDAAVKEG